MEEDAFGFERRNKKPKIDFNDLPKAPAEPDPEIEKLVMAVAERRGFTPREQQAFASQPPVGLDSSFGVGQGGLTEHVPSDALQKPVERTRVKKAKPASKSVLVKGPQAVIDRFIGFANDGEYEAYWEALRDLLDQHAENAKR